MEKRKQCNIVQDLLLNYIDGILSDDSKEFVEDHLKNCKECELKFNDMKTDIEVNNKYNEDKEIDYLKKVKKKITKRNKCILIISIILAIVIILNLIVFINYNKETFKIDIYFNGNIAEEELEKIKQNIKLKDEKAEIVYYSKYDELEKMRQNLEEKQYLLENYENQIEIFPEHLEVKSKKKNIIKDLEQDLVAIPNIRTIYSNVNDNPYMLFLEKILSIFN